MSSNIQMEMTNALDTMYNILNNEAVNIKNELKKELENNFGKNNFSVTISRGNVKNFRNYIWVNVEDIENDRFYSLNLFYNDINVKSANFRTQFGRFQFWRDVIIENKEVPSPHECIVNDRNVVLYCLDEKSYNPKQAIYDGTYNLETLISEFIDFYKKSL